MMTTITLRMIVQMRDGAHEMSKHHDQQRSHKFSHAAKGDRSHRTASTICKWFKFTEGKKHKRNPICAPWLLSLSVFLIRFSTNWNNTVTAKYKSEFASNIRMVLFRSISFRYVLCLFLSCRLDHFRFTFYENQIDSCSHSHTNTHKGGTAFTEPI